MEILLDRFAKKESYTISRVYVNGERFGDGERWCNALEDTDRGLFQGMALKEIYKRKIKGKTAVPRGTYQIQITYSPRIKQNLPLLVDVPGFTGIRIHAGNDAKDTDGCLLLGENTQRGKVLNSRYWCARMQTFLQNAINRGEKITITIR